MTPKQGVDWVLTVVSEKNERELQQNRKERERGKGGKGKRQRGKANEKWG